MLISLLHPSRQRPEKSLNTTIKWLANAGCEVELIVSVDVDDPLLPQYRSIYDSAKLIVNENRSAVDAINNAAKVAKGDVLLVLSDDTDCFFGWGKALTRAIGDKKDFILKVNDGIQRWIITMPVMDREYYNRFGYVYYPGYKHMFCDTEITHVADCLKKIIKKEDLRFPHKHYSVTRQPADEINKRADLTWNQGKKLYLQRVRNGFDLGLNWRDISDPIHLRWLNKALNEY